MGGGGDDEEDVEEKEEKFMLDMDLVIIVCCLLGPFLMGRALVLIMERWSRDDDDVDDNEVLLWLLSGESCSASARDASAWCHLPLWTADLATSFAVDMSDSRSDGNSPKSSMRQQIQAIS